MRSFRWKFPAMIKKDVVIIGDSMLNNVNSCGLSKSKKVEVLNIPGANSTHIVNKMDDILVDKSKSILVLGVTHKRCESSQQF